MLYENSLEFLKEKKANEIACTSNWVNPNDSQAIANVRLDTNQSLVCYTGVCYTTAYADDHVTVVAISVRKGIAFSVKRELVFKQIWSMRCLIKDATIDMGCDVEPSKSETIFSTQVLEHSTVDYRFKTMFKWLGYWLELKKNGLLWLDEDEVDKKLNSQEYFARVIFQYTESTAFRWKIWKTYFSPFVELFLPAVFQKSFGVRTRVHTFQHRIMCWALGLCEVASVSRLQIATGEPFVEFKARRAATRLLNCMNAKYDFQIKRTTGRNRPGCSDTEGEHLRAPSRRSRQQKGKTSSSE